ncbi:MAG: peptidoglycan DD-metalloendopeptidase family protein [Sphingobacteriaceae bacterium]|jgi:septal ring factor EnvC (AmiA/AmiB activator)|nr:peptidoglycan DD-metalloendopeptidase family protein [Sphingobacteriaceae bacterium]
MKFLRLLPFLAFLLIAGTAFAQSSAELKRRKDALSREIELLNKSLRNTSSNKKLSLKQINALNAQIRLREQKIGTINSEVRLLDNEIADNTSTVHSLQSQLEKLKKGYASMVLFAFHNQSAYSKLMFVFAAKDFNQGYMRLRYLHQFGEYRQKQAQYIKETARQLNIKIVELDHNKRKKSSLLQDQEKEKQTLGKQKVNQSKVLSTLAKQESKYKKEIYQKQKEAAKLSSAINAAIRREIEEERRKAEEEARKEAALAKAENRAPVAAKPIAKGSSILSATPESAKLSSDFLGSRGNLPWPVAAGTIVETFGTHKYGVNVSVENSGIDIKTPAGAAVRAIFSGTVGRIVSINGSQTVIIRHGEYFSIYSNLRSVSVSSGQKVTTKQNIGTVATDSDDGTTQVHLEIWKVSTPTNPESWLAN